jgi:hypothetical protein
LFSYDSIAGEDGKHIWLRVTGTPGIAKGYIYDVLNSQIEIYSAYNCFLLLALIEATNF